MCPETCPRSLVDDGVPKDLGRDVAEGAVGAQSIVEKLRERGLQRGVLGGNFTSDRQPVRDLERNLIRQLVVRAAGSGVAWIRLEHE